MERTPGPAAGKGHLLLLPGMLLGPGLFRHQSLHLSDLVDVSVGDLTVGETVGEMAGAVLEAAPPRFSLAGLSLGGIVAFEVMRRAPERVERLALLDTNARPPTEAQLETWDTFARMTREGDFRAVVRRHILPTLFFAEDAVLEGRAGEMAEAVGERAFGRQLAAQASRPDSREGLGDIDCPTLVACGRQDALCPVELHEEIRSLVPGAALVVVEDCGHLSTMERPQAATALLRYWMQAGVRAGVGA